MIWEGRDVKKVDLNVLDIGWTIIQKASLFYTDALYSTNPAKETVTSSRSFPFVPRRGKRKALNNSNTKTPNFRLTISQRCATTLCWDFFSHWSCHCCLSFSALTTWSTSCRSASRPMRSWRTVFFWLGITGSKCCFHKWKIGFISLLKLKSSHLFWHSWHLKAFSSEEWLQVVFLSFARIHEKCCVYSTELLW